MGSSPTRPTICSNRIKALPVLAEHQMRVRFSLAAYDPTKEECEAIVNSLLALPREEFMKLLKENETSSVALALQEIWSTSEELLLLNRNRR